MPSLFKQVKDNVSSSTTTNLSATGVVSLVLATGDGAKFPLPGNGFRITLWDNIGYPNNSGADPNMEIVVCSARSTDTLTISPTTKTHPNPCTVAQLATAEDIIDLQTAINAAETTLVTRGDAFLAGTQTWTGENIFNLGVIEPDANSLLWFLTANTDGSIQTTPYSDLNTPADMFLTEDGLNFFVTEDGLSYLEQES